MLNWFNWESFWIGLFIGGAAGVISMGLLLAAVDAMRENSRPVDDGEEKPLNWRVKEIKQRPADGEDVNHSPEKS